MCQVDAEGNRFLAVRTGAASTTVELVLTLTAQGDSRFVPDDAPRIRLTVVDADGSTVTGIMLESDGNAGMGVLLAAREGSGQARSSTVTMTVPVTLAGSRLTLRASLEQDSLVADIEANDATLRIDVEFLPLLALETLAGEVLLATTRVEVESGASTEVRVVLTNAATLDATQSVLVELEASQVVVSPVDADFEPQRRRAWWLPFPRRRR